MTTPERITTEIDAALKEYTAGIDRAVRFVTIDQVDMLAEFYLHNRAAVAASKPADPVTNADSRQRVTVKPLVWADAKISDRSPRLSAECIIGTYEALQWSSGDFGWSAPNPERELNNVEYGGVPTLEAAIDAAQADYAARIIAALDVQPDPRDAQIAALVDAIENIRVTYLLPPSFQLPLDLAIAAVKGGDA